MFLDSPGFQVLSASQMLFLIFASFILGGGGGAGGADHAASAPPRHSAGSDHRTNDR